MNSFEDQLFQEAYISNVSVLALLEHVGKHATEAVIKVKAIETAYDLKQGSTVVLPNDVFAEVGYCFGVINTSRLLTGLMLEKEDAELDTISAQDVLKEAKELIAKIEASMTAERGEIDEILQLALFCGSGFLDLLEYSAGVAV